MWRNQFDFSDLDFYDFDIFEMVVNITDVQNAVNGALNVFTIDNAFKLALSTAIFNYGIGKMINLKNSKAWRDNLLAEIQVFLLEKARYLQVYTRNVEQNRLSDGNSRTETNTIGRAGESNTKNSGYVGNTQNVDTDAGNTQSGTERQNHTSFILHNQTTSTNYLASMSENADSEGNISETTVNNVRNSNSNNIEFNIENGGRLSGNVDNTIVDVDKEKSPLDAVALESAFNFQEFFKDLIDIIDMYFLGGGNQHYA